MMNKSVSKKILREFGILVGIGVPILVGWILPTILGHSFRSWTMFISLPFLISAILKPIFLYWPYQVWMKLGESLGWINSKLILGLIFILVVQPIALIMKIFNYDPLKLKKRNVNTYREGKTTEKIDLKRIF